MLRIFRTERTRENTPSALFVYWHHTHIGACFSPSTSIFSFFLLLSHTTKKKSHLAACVLLCVFRSVWPLKAFFSARGIIFQKKCHDATGRICGMWSFEDDYAPFSLLFVWREEVLDSCDYDDTDDWLWQSHIWSGWLVADDLNMRSR